MTRVPTVAEAAEAIGIPVKRWEGNCFGIASALVDNNLVDGVAVYGHYWGPVVEGSMFFGHGLIHHGWVQLADGTIIDPTRWAFEMVEPYIYVGKPGDEGHDNYDEGGNRWRMKMMRPPPPFDPNAKIIPLHDHLDEYGRMYVTLLIGAEPPWSAPQAFWLANLPVHCFENWAREVYQAFGKEDAEAFVPIDNWRMVMEGRTHLDAAP